MEMTGPEHAARAEALLCGAAKWPSRVPDRMAAAQAHSILALVSLIAHAVTEDDEEQHRIEARAYDWRATLPVPYLLDLLDAEDHAATEQEQGHA